MNFGRTLKEVRKEHGESLRSLAEKIGVAFSYIDRIEREENPVSKTILEKILRQRLLQKNRLIKFYLGGTLLDEVQKEIGLRIENSFLNDMKSLIKILDK